MDVRGFRVAVPVVAVGKQLAGLLVVVAAYCIFVGFAVHRWNIEQIDWGAEATLINGVILGLLYGFRNRTAYDRWWEGRRLWGQLVNDSRNLAAKFAAFVPPHAPSRDQLAPLIVGFAYAMKQRLRGEAFDPSTLPASDAPPGHVPTWIAARLYALVAGWKRQGLLDDALTLSLEPSLRGLLDVCGGCERIANTPLSAAYKGLLRFGLAVNIVVVPWVAMSKLGPVGLPVFLVACFFLLGVELIDSRIEEPFGRDPEDLDLDRYCETIRECVAMCLPAAASDETPRGDHESSYAPKALHTQ